MLTRRSLFAMLFAAPLADPLVSAIPVAPLKFAHEALTALPEWDSVGLIARRYVLPALTAFANSIDTDMARLWASPLCNRGRLTRLRLDPARLPA